MPRKTAHPAKAAPVTTAATLPETPPLSDADALRRLWRLTLEGSIKNLEGGDANAAGLNVARQFLADQGVDHRSLQHLDQGFRFDPRDLPTFDD